MLYLSWAYFPSGLSPAQYVGSSGFQYWWISSVLAGVLFLVVGIWLLVWVPLSALRKVGVAFRILVYCGVSFGYAYAAIAGTSGGAFTGYAPTVADFYYFSFATLTTTGYGDILPISHLARFVAVTEMLTGIGLMTIGLAAVAASLLSEMEERRFQRMGRLLASELADPTGQHGGADDAGA